MIRLSDVLQMTGWGRSTHYNRINDGLFIKPVSLGARAAGYPLNEVEQILSYMIAGKTQDEIRQLVSHLENNRQKLVA